MIGQRAGVPEECNDATATMVEPPATFEEFFHAECDALFRVLVVITRDRQEAEDISQEAFARVWERWDSVSVMENPTGYLHRVAMNLFRSRFRRAVLATQRAIEPPPPRDEFQAVDDRQVVIRALEGLSPRRRAAIVLTEVLGYSAEEAGHMLGIRASTVRALHFQARSALRQVERGSDV